MSILHRKNLLLIFFLLIPTLSLGHQKARVIKEEVRVHERPEKKSPVIGELTIGQKVRSSSKWVTDSKGINWYKVMTPQGSFGYVQANALETDELKRELASNKVESFLEDPNGYHLPRDWGFVLRGMGFAAVTGVSASNSSLTPGPLVYSIRFGGEGELTYTFSLADQGIASRSLALGAVYSNLIPGETFLGGSLVIQPNFRTAIQPQLRLRLGKTESTVFWGGALGIRFFLVRFSRVQFAGFIDAGVLLSASMRQLYPYAAAGLGIHF
ncbi:MAG: SH3 domain-containing protein [Bdellovibrionia bacterium]